MFNLSMPRSYGRIFSEGTKENIMVRLFYDMILLSDKQISCTVLPGRGLVACRSISGSPPAHPSSPHSHSDHHTSTRTGCTCRWRRTGTRSCKHRQVSYGATQSTDFYFWLVPKRLIYIIHDCNVHMVGTELWLFFLNMAKQRMFSHRETRVSVGFVHRATPSWLSLRAMP